MKSILLCVFLLLTSFVYSQSNTDFSGFWKLKWKVSSGYNSITVSIKSEGTFYSIALKLGSNQAEWKWTANLINGVLKARTKTEDGDSPTVTALGNNKIKVSNLYLMGSEETELSRWNRNDIILDVNSFWNNFKIAYAKKDKNALTNLLELPIRENMFNTKYGDNPSLNLSTFLIESKDLQKYNLNKSAPILNQKLKSYASFEGYKFNPSDQIYEIKLKRNTSNTSGFEMALYVKANNGVFKLFAFDPEISFNNIGD